VVPSPVVPRPLVPRAVTPRPFVFGEVVAVGVVRVPRPNDTGEVGAEALALGAVAAEFAKFREPVTPELLLTELHGADIVFAAPMPEVVKPVVGLRPPLVGLSPLPPKVVRATAPGPPLVQGAGLATSVYGAGVIWELSPKGWPKSAPSGDVAPTSPWLGMPVGELPRGWPKSDPSGDVAPMVPGLGMSVCAALWPRPSGVMETITAVMRKNFIGAAASFAFPFQ
jgi:hypothetical protein